MFDDAAKFEKAPGASGEVSGERIEKVKEWSDAMTNAPEFAGDQFGVAKEENNYYGETVKNSEDQEEYNKGITEAAALINYGLNAASRELGVEQTVQKIKSFNTEGTTDPIGDLYHHLGIDTNKEKKDLREEAMASKPSENGFRNASMNAPQQRRSLEGAIEAINDMKELITEVEGADPRYDKLRAGAKAAGKGYFEYAVSGYGVRGLTELFQVLGKQKKDAEEEMKKEEVKEEESAEKEEGEGKEGEEGEKGTGSEGPEDEEEKKRLEEEEEKLKRVDFDGGTVEKDGTETKQ